MKGVRIALDQLKKRSFLLCVSRQANEILPPSRASKVCCYGDDDVASASSPEIVHNVVVVFQGKAKEVLCWKIERCMLVKASRECKRLVCLWVLFDRSYA
jgi:hypothetical protein